MTRLIPWRITPEPEEAFALKGTKKFSQFLAEIAEIDRARAAADPTFGTDKESVKDLTRLGPYGSASSAHKQGWTANLRYAKELGGEFEVHSQLVESKKRPAWLLMRFVPDKLAKRSS